MSGNVSFKEFLHQYNELKRWLEQMQFSYSDSISSFCEKYTNQVSLIIYLSFFLFHKYQDILNIFIFLKNRYFTKKY